MTDAAFPGSSPAPGGEVSDTAARRRALLEQWRLHSRKIHLLRRILPGAMAAILVLLIGWVAIGDVLTRLGEAGEGANASIHMTNARFYGRDGLGRAYVLGATMASRVNGDLRKVVLVGPILTFGAGGPKESHIEARRGVYREDDRILRLNDNVRLRDQTGNLFITDQAIVDTVRGTVVGKSNVKGFGPTGIITADSFAVSDQGRRVVFTGDVHSRFKQD